MECFCSAAERELSMGQLADPKELAEPKEAVPSRFAQLPSPNDDVLSLLVSIGRQLPAVHQIGYLWVRRSNTGKWKLPTSKNRRWFWDEIKQPKLLEQWDGELPKNFLGKIMRRYLREASAGNSPPNTESENVKLTV